MHVRDVISGTLLVAVFVLLGVVGWQTVANNSAIEKFGTKLEAVVNGPRPDGGALNVLAAIPPERTANQENPQPAKSRTDPVLPAPVDLNQLANDVAKLQSQEAELVNIAEERSKALRDVKLTEKELIAAVSNSTKILGDIAKDSGRGYVPNVQAIQKDHDSRQELVEMVVHDSIRSSGKLVIRNDMSTAQWIRVNGRNWGVAAHGGTLSVDVPSGTAITEYAGEGPKSWFIGLPNYTQDIIIGPAVRNTEYSAGTQYGPWRQDPMTGALTRDILP
jgi:hypothetical protein